MDYKDFKSKHKEVLDYYDDLPIVMRYIANVTSYYTVISELFKLKSKVNDDVLVKLIEDHINTVDKTLTNDWETFKRENLV